MTKKIIFRADGNSTTGLGHLYRLFSLVETVKKDVDYVLLTRANSTLSVFPKDYNVELIPTTIELQVEVDWIANKFPSNEYILIADGYQFTSAYQKLIKDKGYTMMYIDDLAKEHMYADVVLNHSPQLSIMDFSAENYTKFALGMDYALLRPSFLKIAEENRKFNKIDAAFVNFGGVDKYDLTFKTAQVLVELQQIKHIHIVLGPAFNQENINLLQKHYPTKINIYKNLSEEALLKVMKSCDIAIAPTSTILFELFCVKIPVYSGYFVENQRKTFESFKMLKLVFGEGSLTQITHSNFLNKIKEFINSPNHQSIMNNQKKMIDGKQRQRHLNLINKLLS